MITLAMNNNAAEIAEPEILLGINPEVLQDLRFSSWCLLFLRVFSTKRLIHFQQKIFAQKGERYKSLARQHQGFAIALLLPLPKTPAQYLAQYFCILGMLLHLEIFEQYGRPFSSSFIDSLTASIINETASESNSLKKPTYNFIIKSGAA
ncbi:hypothetical protein [Acetobacter okinawensis]|uniref:hypothetical protein n=1 Tax=Acetobacter okinawensis TaxID=1076594 RepID=UPI00117898D7|nr:hypothetical protein [Acetobacter okinawensis]